MCNTLPWSDGLLVQQPFSWISVGRVMCTPLCMAWLSVGRIMVLSVLSTNKSISVCEESFVVVDMLVVDAFTSVCVRIETRSGPIQNVEGRMEVRV